MKNQIEIIKKLSADMSMLYVEDNLGLRENMHKLLGRVISNVIVAKDGEDGLNQYIKHKPDILITDIDMPKMNGFDMIKKIKKIGSDSKIIVLSAHDEKQHLHIAIKLGVFRYLSKPAKIPELIQAIYDSVLSIHEEENRRLFLNQMKSILNYQNNIVAMVYEGKFIFANHRFFEFFGVESLESFYQKYTDIDTLLLEHKEFLFSTPSASWLNIIEENPETLFHTKIKNYKDENRHLILKSRIVPEKNNHTIFSFDDITELNLMPFFDSESNLNDAALQDKKSIITFMKIVQSNSANVKIHNFYKGLTIVNPATIAGISDDEIILKTVNAQLKIVALANFMTISSEIFPRNIICKSIKATNPDNQTIVIHDMSYTSRSATDRKYTRLEPEDTHSFILFYKNMEFSSYIKIVDISEVSVKIKMSALPAGIAIEDKVKISVNIDYGDKHLKFITSAVLYRIEQYPESYNVVMLFELDKNHTDTVRAYLSFRQMALIREFKKIDIY
ncbi:response regulator [bacterium]|nr:response regulator [bacterium]MBU1993945.1 response regulator [bacterium]